MAGRYDIATGRKPQEDSKPSRKRQKPQKAKRVRRRGNNSSPVELINPIPDQTMGSRPQFYLRRVGGEEVPIYVGDLNTSVSFNPLGEVITSISMDFVLTQEQVRQLNGR